MSRTKRHTLTAPPPLEVLASSVSSPIRSVTEQELATADQLGRRLQAELRSVIGLVPAPWRGGSAMARVLGVDRATCQRVIGAVSGDAGAHTLVKMPGVEGLRQFLSAVLHAAVEGPVAERVAAANVAVDRFAELLEELGGSQRRLKERLGVLAEGVPAGAAGLQAPSDDEKSREALFRAAATITGRWSALTLSVAIIRPTDSDPLLTEAVRAHGVIGHAWRDQSVPLEIGQTASQRASEGGPAFATLDALPASGHSPGSLLEEFCSKPLPRVVSKALGPRTVHVIDSDAGVSAPIDVVTAHRSSSPDRHPMTLRPAVGEIWALQHVASRHLVFDTYLHREIARRCIPSLEAHLWTPDVMRHGAARWSTRFPGGPRLTVLGQGLRGVATRAYARMGALVEHIFTRRGWNAEEFVGFRCEVAYPLWRGGYCMSFDFEGTDETTQATSEQLS